MTVIPFPRQKHIAPGHWNGSHFGLAWAVSPFSAARTLLQLWPAFRPKTGTLPALDDTAMFTCATGTLRAQFYGYLHERDVLVRNGGFPIALRADVHHDYVLHISEAKLCVQRFDWRKVRQRADLMDFPFKAREATDVAAALVAYADLVLGAST